MLDRSDVIRTSFIQVITILNTLHRLAIYFLTAPSLNLIFLFSINTFIPLLILFLIFIYLSFSFLTLKMNTGSISFLLSEVLL